MNYTEKDLKDMIGSQAENIIINDLNLKSLGGSKYACCITEHRKGNENAPMEFFQDGFTFHCHDCKENYDIINHAGSMHNGVEFWNYLKQLAGVVDGVFKKQEAKKPLQQKQKKVNIKKYNANFSGLEPVQFKGSFDSQDAFNYLDSRCISEKIARLFYVSGDTQAIYLNYWANNGQNLELAKIKGRRIGDIKNGQEKYLRIGGGNEILFGAHLYQSQRVLIVCEGEFDALAMSEGIYHIGAQSHAMAVSVPSGSGSVKWVETCEEFLKKFQTIVICSDLDKSGIKMREKCFEAMKNYDVRWIDLGVFLNPKHYIDLNDLLITRGKKTVGDLLKHVEKPYHSCGMYANKIKREDRKDLFFTGFYGLDRCCKFKLGELAVLAGESNDGKTTITRQMMITAVQNGLKVGALFGEETPEKFRDLTIRQAYHGQHNFESTPDYFGDNEFTAKFEVEDNFNNQYGKNINLFQLDRVRDIEKIGDKILDWIAHCSDIEGIKFFICDNLMKITADEDSDEYVAQAKFVEKLYRMAQKKGVFILMIVHTKKITGLIDQNSIHGTKKIYNTPDYVLFFQRMDRFKSTKEYSRDQAFKDLQYQCRLPDGQDFTSFIWAHKIRDRNPSYTIDCHAMEYDFKTTCSTELLTSKYNTKVHENGWSRIVNKMSPEDSNF